MSIDQEPRVEVRDRHQFLLINTQPTFVQRTLDFPPYSEWFSSAMGVGMSRFQVVNIADGERLPETITASGIIIGGSAMSVTDMDSTPWMQELAGFIRHTEESKVPLLGVCFGHQMVAKALGGNVEKGTVGRELGKTHIDLNIWGQRDPLFTGVPNSFEIATSHSDVVSKLPDGGMELAYNAAYPNQAMRVGKHIRTIQAHPEMDCDIVATIVEARKDALVSEGITTEELFPNYLRAVKALDHKPGEQILRNFNQYYVGPHAVQ